MAILKSLIEDGRKSFRAVSREIKVSTPTVKARYDRLVNMGLVKSVKPEIDLSKIDIHKQKLFLARKILSNCVSKTSIFISKSIT
jgi:DNA-binding Lrp family transcriptional regulator